MGSQNSDKQRQLDKLQRRIGSLESSIQKANEQLNLLESRKEGTSDPRYARKLDQTIGRQQTMVDTLERRLEDSVRQRRTQAADYYSSSFRELSAKEPVTLINDEPRLSESSEAKLEQISSSYALPGSEARKLRKSVFNPGGESSGDYFPWLVAIGVLVAMAIATLPRSKSFQIEPAIAAPLPGNTQVFTVTVPASRPQADGWLLLGTVPKTDGLPLVGTPLSGALPISRSVVPNAQETVRATMDISLQARASSSAQLVRTAGPDQEIKILDLQTQVTPGDPLTQEVWASVELCPDAGCR